MRSIAKSARLAPATIRAWERDLGSPKVEPPILHEAVPVSHDDRRALPAELDRIAADLEQADLREHATIVRRASDALRADDELDTEPGPDPADDTRGWILSMIARTQRSYDRAEAVGNATAAKQYASALERWSKTLTQHDRASADGDVIRLHRGDLEKKRDALRELMRAITAEPLRCSECNRAVRVAWVEQDAN